MLQDEQVTSIRGCISENVMNVIKVLCCLENVFALPVTQNQQHEGSRFVEIV